MIVGWSFRAFFAAAVALVAFGPPCSAGAADEAAKVEYFEREVRPIFAARCAACHSAETKPAGGLRVDDRRGLLTGGASGPAVVPGKPEESLLLRRTAHDAKRRMPAEGEPLTDAQRDAIARWIADGAAWPAVEVSIARDLAEYATLRAEHWAFQPLVRHAAPTVRDAGWSRDDVDRFLLSRLEASGLEPTSDAEPAVWLRRVTFDLTGLPPTQTELGEFLADDSPGARERAVDRLLKSSAFGEQWGRHWLDVARYGESTGPSRNIPYPHAWRYRDYVIDAVNRDLPYPQFVVEQIAGDLLTSDDPAERDRRRIATGFLALGVKDVNQRFEVRFVMDNVDEQIDVVTRSILGLTVSCARCHDHKFDPVPQHDYYALAGVFTSTQIRAGLRNQMGGAGLAYYVPRRLVVLSDDRPPADPAEVARVTEEVRVAKEKWDAVRGTPEGLKPDASGVPFQRTLRRTYDEAQARLLALTDPAERGVAAHGVSDAEAIGDTELRVRGEAEQIGPAVPRGFLTAFSSPVAASFSSQESGRRQLAEWLVHDSNPLAPRVFVNRVWARLFDVGLVGTVDNFGVTGDSPSHPELLDYLALETIKDGWSLKRLVRRLVLTRAYGLSAVASAQQRAVDPAGRLRGRYVPRRLAAEEYRDAVLAAAGTLDPSRPAASAVAGLKMIELRDNGPEARTIQEQAGTARVRSVYLPQLRGVVPRSLLAFDPVDRTLVAGRRETTTTPSQSLFVLNSPFVRRHAHEFARRLLAAEPDEGRRVAVAYRSVLGRPATDAEAARTVRFLADFAAAYRETPVLAGTGESTGVAEAPATAGGAAANPDEADQSGVPIVEETARPADAAEAAWTAFAQALFASAEFRYVR